MCEEMPMKGGARNDKATCLTLKTELTNEVMSSTF